MKTFIAFFKATIVGGVLFLLPLVLVLFLIQKALSLAGAALDPITRHLPNQTVLGVALGNIVAVLVLLMLCFLAGLAMRTKLGARFNARLERLASRRVPGFALAKSLTQGLAGLESDSGVRVALMRMEDAWVFAFVVERITGGLFAVFVPGAPNPASGSIYFVTEDRIRLLDIPVSKATRFIMRFGNGSREIFEGRSQFVDDLVHYDLAA
jgi:uncharacterized membrane protein